MKSRSHDRAASADAIEFVRFCYRRRRVGWPELYDEMCAVAGRGLFRGWGSDELSAEGIGFSLFEMPALAVLVERSPVPAALSGRVDRLPAPVEAAFFFVCSEALANVAKHAAASSVSIAVREQRGRVVVAVADNGVGGADVSRGSGLRGLTDRVVALGGTLLVESTLGMGTRVVAEIPLT